MPEHWKDKGIRPDMSLADYTSRKEVNTLPEIRRINDIADDVYSIEAQLLVKEGMTKESWLSEAKKLYHWYKARFPEADITVSDNEGNHGWSYRGVGR